VHIPLELSMAPFFHQQQPLALGPGGRPSLAHRPPLLPNGGTKEAEEKELLLAEKHRYRLMGVVNHFGERTTSGLNFKLR
jgi:hypothetical protein